MLPVSVHQVETEISTEGSKQLDDSVNDESLQISCDEIHESLISTSKVESPGLSQKEVLDTNHEAALNLLQLNHQNESIDQHIKISGETSPKSNNSDDGTLTTDILTMMDKTSCDTDTSDITDGNIVTMDTDTADIADDNIVTSDITDSNIITDGNIVTMDVDDIAYSMDAQVTNEPSIVTTFTSGIEIVVSSDNGTIPIPTEDDLVQANSTYSKTSEADTINQMAEGNTVNQIVEVNTVNQFVKSAETKKRERGADMPML